MCDTKPKVHMSESLYNIKDLEKLAGVKAHTIRIWEKRYNLLTPKRTSNNVRLYSDADLKKILNVSILINCGHKISKIATYDHQKISHLITEIGGDTKTNGHEVEIDRFIEHTLSFYEPEFSEHFSHCVLKHGLEKTITKIIYPFLNKVGLLWGISEIYPAQEHFASQLIKRKLWVAIDGLEGSTTSKEAPFILFLPENELHELALIFSNYILRRNGHNVVYLGANVPQDNLLMMKKNRDIKGLITFFINPMTHEEIETYLQQLSEHFSDSEIYFSGAQKLVDNLNTNSNVHKLNSPKELEKL